MKKESLAGLLNGREYGSEIMPDESALAKKHGLVVVYGASDDLCEFDGAIQDEANVYDGGKIKLDRSGLVPDRSQIDDDDAALKDYFKREPKAAIIEALWCQEKGYSWTYKTNLPHATFEIMEDGEHYCRGIVIEASSMTVSMNPRVNYEMTEVDYQKIIEACKPVPYIVIGGVTPRSQQENANDAWAELGSRMGFESMTVQPGNSKLAFTAMPSETKPQKQERLAHESEQKRLLEIETLRSEISKRQTRLDELTRKTP